MATKQLFTNNAISTLASGIGAGDTSLTVATSDGARFPSPAATEHFMATLIDVSQNYEIVKVTARSGDVFTIVRAQEGTSAMAFSTADKVELRLTKGGAERFSQKDTDESFGGKKTFDAGAAVPAGQQIDNVWTTGDVKITMKVSADAGWVFMNDGTIGNASSGATTRANADTEALFTLLWNNISDTYAPVSSGRGASAAADFAANKTIALPKVLGRALAVAGSGASLTTRVLGETLGAETHQLTTSEMPAHTHGGVTSTDGSHTHGFLVYAFSGSNTDGSSPGSDTSGYTGTMSSAGSHSHTISSQGGDGAHNNMQPSSFFNIMVKL